MVNFMVDQDSRPGKGDNFLLIKLTIQIFTDTLIVMKTQRLAIIFLLLMGIPFKQGRLKVVQAILKGRDFFKGGFYPEKHVF